MVASNQRSEALLAAIVTSTQDAIVSSDEHEVITSWNPAAEQLFGYPAAEAIGQPFALIMPPGNEAERRDFLEHVRQRGAFQRIETTRRNDGVLIDVETTVATIREPGGRILGYISITRDITERKAAETAQAATHQNTREVLERITDGFFALDRAGRVIYINEAAGRLLPRDRDEYLGANYWDQFPQGRESPVAAAIERAMVEGITTSCAFYDAPRDAWYESRVYPSPGGISVFFHDISEQRRAEEALRQSEERFRALVQNAMDIVTILDANGTILYETPASPRVLGYEPGELIGTDPFARIHPEDVGGIQGLFEESLRNPGVNIAADLRFRHKDGSWRWLAVVGTNLLNDPAVGGIVVNSRDITERKLAEQALRRSEASLSEAQRIAHLGNWEWDMATDAVRWSDETYRIYGYEPQAFPPAPERFLERVHPDDRKRARKFHQEDLADLPSGSRSAVEIRVIRRDGDERVVRVEAERVPDDSANPRRVFGTVLDITERREFEARLEYQAFHDSLTNLANRTLFLERLGRALTAHADEGNRGVAVLLLDLDGFKFVNDSRGHAAGDDLLIAIGERLRERLSPGITLARLGGDEFGVLLAGVAHDADEPKRVAQELIALLRAPFVVAGRETFVSASIGISVRVEGGGEPGDLLREADVALYQAKAAGRGTYALFAPWMLTSVVAQLEQETALGWALERDEMRLYYQPKVELATGRVVGVEALVRWQHPEHGLVAPASFIELAEVTGLTVPLGQWVLREACAEASRWLAAGAPALLSVNLSARQLRHPDLVQDVIHALNTSGLDPHRLELEITEDVAMNHGSEIGQTLRALQMLGVGLAIDDFGTGYSSLAYLPSLPVDGLKIDRIFITGLEINPGNRAIVRAVTTLGHDLGLAVTAEGVETAEQAAWLRGLGVDLAQGYYFARPMTSEAVAALLARGTRLPEGSGGANEVATAGTRLV